MDVVLGVSFYEQLKTHGVKACVWVRDAHDVSTAISPLLERQNPGSLVLGLAVECVVSTKESGRK